MFRKTEFTPNFRKTQAIDENHFPSVWVLSKSNKFPYFRNSDTFFHLLKGSLGTGILAMVS